MFNNETIRCTQQRFKSDYHKIYTESVHKIALNNKHNKIDENTTYPIGMNTNLINKLEQEIRQRPIQPFY